MVDQIVTDASVLARIRLTIVHIEFAILSLKAARTLTREASDEIRARGAILTRVRFTFVDFEGTVTARVAFHTMATVAVAEILASTVVTQGFAFQTWRRRRVN